jgi:hypothetical protein
MRCLELKKKRSGPGPIPKPQDAQAQIAKSFGPGPILLLKRPCPKTEKTWVSAIPTNERSPSQTIKKKKRGLSQKLYRFCLSQKLCRFCSPHSHLRRLISKGRIFYNNVKHATCPRFRIYLPNEPYRGPWKENSNTRKVPIPMKR